jgi:hypothetical protein
LAAERRISIGEVFGSAGLDVGGEPVRDSWVAARCPTCADRVPLAACRAGVTGSRTDYRSPCCGAVVLSIAPAPARGYAVGDWALDTPAGLWVSVPPSPVGEAPTTARIESGSR